ncbi:hypothetical protein PIB30_016703 [Stylosanthes scabra]|uniref:Uncharacterized protein n=1 Tax=Stylosanthes scabra TaxID=79078 RepID=A0ABU6Y5Y9_9FABA|nr:hypothetical protein [Stylosanthes scabra]
MLARINDVEKMIGEKVEQSTEKMKHPPDRGVPMMQRKERRRSTHCHNFTHIDEAPWSTSGGGAAPCRSSHEVIFWLQTYMELGVHGHGVWEGNCLPEAHLAGPKPQATFNPLGALASSQ